MMTMKHIRWYVNVGKWTPTREQWLKLTSCIGEDEVKKLNEFVYQEDSKTSLIGQALIRKFLKQAIGLPTNELQLTRTSLGRPEICENYRRQLVEQCLWPQVIDFNVSHTENYCVFAGLWSSRNSNNDIDSSFESSSDMTVGIDVTKVVRKSNKNDLDRFFKLMKNQFLEEEYKTVELVHDDRQKSVNFTRLWCLKESFIKSIGLGLSFDLKRIEFQFDESDRYNLSIEKIRNEIISRTRVLLDGRVSNKWRFLETSLDDEHLVAIGYNEKRKAQLDLEDLEHLINLEELSIDSILNDLTSINELMIEENWLKFSNKSTKEHYYNKLNQSN